MAYTVEETAGPFTSQRGQIADDEPRAQLIVSLTRLALSAPDIPTAVLPALDALVARTAAAGSAYFQVGGEMFKARSASGVLPRGPAMDAILAHGLPSDTPLMRALEASGAPLFFDDTGRAAQTAGFPELGVVSLAAAPVRDRDGTLRGVLDAHLRAARLGRPRV